MRWWLFVLLACSKQAEPVSNVATESKPAASKSVDPPALSNHEEPPPPPPSPPPPSASKVAVDKPKPLSAAHSSALAEGRAILEIEKRDVGVLTTAPSSSPTILTIPPATTGKVTP